MLYSFVWVEGGWCSIIDGCVFVIETPSGHPQATTPQLASISIAICHTMCTPPPPPPLVVQLGKKVAVRGEERTVHLTHLTPQDTNLKCATLLLKQRLHVANEQVYEASSTKQASWLVATSLQGKPITSLLLHLVDQSGSRLHLCQSHLVRPCILSMRWTRWQVQALSLSVSLSDFQSDNFKVFEVLTHVSMCQFKLSLCLYVHCTSPPTISDPPPLCVVLLQFANGHLCTRLWHSWHSVTLTPLTGGCFGSFAKCFMLCDHTGPRHTGRALCQPHLLNWRFKHLSPLFSYPVSIYRVVDGVQL